MGEVVNVLFDERLKQKKTNPALANVLKLMLNSSYGKTITTKSCTTKKIIRNKKDQNVINNYIYNNFNTIRNYRKMRENTYEIEEVCADDSYNRAHIGCAILSFSKRIMNELFNTANDNNMNIYYTDTDSLHCDFDDIQLLAEKYEAEYNKKLIGKQLEQFHTDFDLDGAATEIIATKSIFLGKKSYMDVLEAKDVKGKTVTGYHIRLKGITEQGLIQQARKYDNSYTGLYEDLAKGTEINFCLNPYDEVNEKQKVLFDFNKGSVQPKATFNRNVKF